MLKTPFGSYGTPDVKDYMLCMHSVLPETQVIRFEPKKDESGTLGDIDWETPIFERENPPEDMLSAYTGPCEGDSGAPQWVCLKNINNEAKFVLAAVHTASAGSIYDDNKKEFQSVPCGSNIFRNFAGSPYKREFIIEEEFVRYLALSQGVTHPKIFDWIKEKIRLT